MYPKNLHHLFAQMNLTIRKNLHHLFVQKIPSYLLLHFDQRIQRIQNFQRNLLPPFGRMIQSYLKIQRSQMYQMNL
jgi:hypothetical protein